jgi:ribosomal protein L7/L12
VPDWTQVAQSKADQGATSDEVARTVIQAGASPIDAIKAIRSVLDMDLGSAKAIVHRNLSPEQQAAAERIWDEAERSAVDE